MTDKEIIKALECCLKVEDIDELSHETPDFTTGMTCTLAKDVLIYTRSIEDYDKFKKYIKSEAIREFANRLKYGVSITSGRITCEDIDNLVKEMTEGENG